MNPCIGCLGTGECQACKGSGRSGYFLVAPPKSAKLCSWCSGNGRCRHCGGDGQIAERVYRFQPYIYVETSLQRPTSITAAAFTGGTWRCIDIPSAVLRRTDEAQRGWVAWRVKSHYRENDGRCFLFGDIIGYLWRPSSDQRIPFDIRGNLVERWNQPFTPPMGSLTVKNKVVTTTIDGSLSIRPRSET